MKMFLLWAASIAMMATGAFVLGINFQKERAPTPKLTGDTIVWETVSAHAVRNGQLTQLWQIRQKYSIEHCLQISDIFGRIRKYGGFVVQCQRIK